MPTRKPPLFSNVVISSDYKLTREEIKNYLLKTFKAPDTEGGGFDYLEERDNTPTLSYIYTITLDLETD